MIDHNLLMLSVLPISMVGLAIWALFLNRLTPEQIKEEERQLYEESKIHHQVMAEMQERLARLEEEQRRREHVVIERVRVRPKHRIRTEARSAMSRHWASAAE